MYALAVGHLCQVLPLYRSGLEGHRNIPYTNKGYAAKAD